MSRPRSFAKLARRLQRIVALAEGISSELTPGAFDEAAEEALKRAVGYLNEDSPVEFRPAEDGGLVVSLWAPGYLPDEVLELSCSIEHVVGLALVGEKEDATNLAARFEEFAAALRSAAKEITD